MPSHDVTALQVALNSQAGAALATDGEFGTATKTAMQNYQRSHGLTVSDQPTQQLLDSLHISLAADFPLQPIGQRSFNLPGFLDGPIASIGDYFINFATSKINGVAIALVALAVGWINTRFGFVVPEDIQNLVTGWLVAGGGALIVILRTFFNKPKVVQGVVVPTTK